MEKPKYLPEELASGSLCYKRRKDFLLSLSSAVKALAKREGLSGRLPDPCEIRDVSWDRAYRFFFANFYVWRIERLKRTEISRFREIKGYLADKNRSIPVTITDLFRLEGLGLHHCGDDRGVHWKTIDELAEFCYVKTSVNVVARLSGIFRSAESEAEVPNNLPRATIRRVKTIGDLKAVHRIDLNVYGDGKGLAFESLHAWWTAYPDGLRAVYYSGCLVGGVGIWPVLPQVFEAITTGKLHEEHFSESSFDTSRSPACWYVGGVWIARKYKASRDVLLRVRDAIGKFLVDSPLPEVIYVCAEATTKEGESMLSRSGFKIVDGVDWAGRAPIFMRTYKLTDAREEWCDS